jgi:hypothetical protein
LLLAIAVLAGSTFWAVTNGAEQNDSGWAVGIPSLGYGPKPSDAHQQLILHGVLEDTQQPLLQKRSPSSTAHSRPEQVHAGMRFAVRPDGVDGWRPAGQSSQSSNSQAPINVPSLHSPPTPPTAAKTTPTNDNELDCSGEPARPQIKTNKSASGLADAYGSSSAAQPPANAEEETCQGKATGQVEDDADAEAIVEDTTPVSDDNSEQRGVEQPAQIMPGPAKLKDALSGPPTKNSPAIKPILQQPVEIVPPPPLTKQLMSLRTRVRSVLAGYYKKTLNSKDNDPWEAMHGMLAYGINSRIRQGGPQGQLITSVGWLCYNKPCKGQTLLYVNPEGEVRAKYGVGLQGHLGQLLAMLAQCHVSADYPIHVGNNEFTIHDLIEAEKKTCYPKSELTFKLIALQHYIDLNDKWVNDQGVDWDFPRLMREEMDQPIRGAACGGTHRLSGLSLAVKTRVRRGEPLDGEYAKADEFVKKYQQYAFRLQNKDGSLSTSWFRGAGDDDDINRRIKTTGHILEWLCYSLNDDELRDPRTVRAVTYLANLMYSNYDNEWETGPRCHATHALLLYDERVFRPFDKDGAVAVYRPTPQVAQGHGSSVNR